MFVYFLPSLSSLLSLRSIYFVSAKAWMDNEIDLMKNISLSFFFVLLSTP